MRKLYASLHLLILIIFGVSAIFYFNFTAEDAYIPYRYAENWVNTGSLVFNQGEPINAMTSPLHAILSAGIFFATGQTVLGNKIIGLFLLLVSALIVWIRFRNYPQWQALALVLTLTPPSILLWAIGGLETPILLFLATITVFIVDQRPSFSFTSLLVVSLSASLALLTRYDSVLFFLPLTIYAATRAQSIKHVVIAILAAAVLPVIWFAISMIYYGDLLPTSFYVKTPNGGAGNLIFNAKYIGSYLVFIGIIPVLIAAFALLRSKHRSIDLFYSHFKSKWWLYLGLLLELLYGLTMATYHMMFSFRFFVPYLPAAAILVVDLARRASEKIEEDWSSLKSASLFAGALVCLLAFQLYQNIYTYHHSVNGIALVGEYRSLGVRDYVRFMGILEQEAKDIENHWTGIKASQDRRPRIITYAAGILPYTYRDSYIYEQLVTFRHCFQRHDQALYADYIHILAPRHGQVSELLPGADERYSLVSSYDMFFDGSNQKFLVYYNPKPEDNNISARIYEPCLQGD